MTSRNEMMIINTDNVDHMLTLAENMAEKQLGEYMNDVSISLGKRNARYIHQSVVVLGKVGNSAGIALRQKVSEMYTTSAYRELELPIENDPSQKITFEYFSDWLHYAIGEAGINDTAASTLNTFVENIVDPVAKRLITHTDGTPFEVNEVLSLREGHTQRLASAARSIMKRDPDDYDKIGELLELAQDPETTAEDLSDIIRTNNLSTPRISPAECNTIQVGDKTIYTIVMEGLQQTKIDAGLSGRVEYRSRSIEDMNSFWLELGKDDMTKYMESLKNV